MRLTVKLIAALSLAILLVLGANAFVRINREVALFENDIRKDTKLLGRALAGAVARIWSTVGETEALDLVEDADERESHVIIRWLWLDRDPLARHALTAELLAKLKTGQTVSIKAPSPQESAPSLFTYVPVDLPDGRSAAIELRESLGAERLYLERTVLQAVVTTGALVLICGLLASVLGILLVGRPVRRLVDQARRIGSGNLEPTDAPSGRDEIAELAREMNSMCSRLLDARTHLEAETLSRLATQEQLRHADRLTTVGKLAAGIAHEVGTPLNVITGHAQLVKEEYPSGSSAHQNVEIIAEQAHRVTAIIRQLLDFARQRTLRKASQELGALARQVSVLLAPLAQKHKVSIMTEIADDEIHADVDAGQIQQVITNLVVNGIQAMSPGGVLHIGTERSLRAAPDSPDSPEREYGVIYVSDNGAGISSVDLPRVFEPFFTTKEVGDGTGLGLSVAYGIVKEHGGWIDAQSTIGSGTRFTVYLPSEAPHA